MAALGFAPHSGWAAAVCVAEVDGRPVVLARERVVLADPDDPDSKQPYHAVEGWTVPEAAKQLEAWSATAEGFARQAVGHIVEEAAARGHTIFGLGILDSAGRKDVPLASILASHALIHSADGDHYRAAIAAAAGRCGLPAHRVRAGELEAKAAEATGTGVESLRLALKEMGRAVGPPWGADQKSAALLAWLVLRLSGP
jgi:hypothetical protein